MSNAEPDVRPPDVPGWDRLELTVRRLLDDRDAWKRRALTAEKKARDLETTLQDVSTGRLDPVAVSNRAQSLERENRLLNRRVRRAHAAVERILNRIQFVEDDR